MEGAGGAGGPSDVAVAGVGTVHLSLTPSCLKPWSRTGKVGDGQCWGLSASSALNSKGEK